VPREPADLIVGRHPVAEALRAGVALRHLYLAEGMRPSPVLDEIVHAAQRADLLARPVRRLVLVEGITDPANLGSILRSADAFGWEGVLVPEHRSVGITPAVRKVSAGATERVPVVRTGSAAATISLLQERHAFGAIGLDPAAAVDYHEADYPERTCLVVGAEGPGLSRLVKQRCDLTVRIPMRGALASVNAAVAAAIVMAEAARHLQ
jgi:23S rRNA (guanosine2251-2'-O)-methyltransferase